MSQESGAELPAGRPQARSLEFGLNDLPSVRQVTEGWAAAAGLPAERADDFVLAVNEIATNAVLHGVPPARLLLRADAQVAVAEVSDRGRWQPGGPVGVTAWRGGMGLPLARTVCDEVEIRAGRNGTTVLLRMRMARPGPGHPRGDRSDLS